MDDWRKADPCAACAVSAVEAGAPVIATHNVRDFDGMEEKFGIRALTPRAVLMEMEESS